MENRDMIVYYPTTSLHFALIVGIVYFFERSDLDATSTPFKVIVQFGPIPALLVNHFVEFGDILPMKLLLRIQ